MQLGDLFNSLNLNFKNLKKENLELWWNNELICI